MDTVPSIAVASTVPQKPVLRIQRPVMESITPPEFENQIKTVFIGQIPFEMNDIWMNRILRLKEWQRATDEKDKPLKYGFAEYEDAKSLNAAVKLIQECNFPNLRGLGSVKLLVTVDERSHTLKNERTNSEEELTNAKSILKGIVQDYRDPKKREKVVVTLETKESAEDDAAAVQSSIPRDEDLVDIPVEQRSLVAREIAAFRDRSNSQDVERLKREKAIEAQQEREASRKSAAAEAGKQRTLPVPDAASRLVALDRSSSSSPTPKINVTGHNLYSGSSFDDGISEEELERRRVAKADRDLEIAYEARERRWLSRERTRTAALEREMKRLEEKRSNYAVEREAMAQRLAEWDDALEKEKGVEEYYTDRESWVRHRAAFRAQESREDRLDREAEEAESGSRGTSRTPGIEAPHSLHGRDEREPARFKLSFAGARKAVPETVKNVSEVEGLLDNEEGDRRSQRSSMAPLDSREPVKLAQQQEKMRKLAEEIPADKDGIWAWDISWRDLPESVIYEKLTPFIRKKITEYLGVQEDDLITFIVDHIKRRGSPADLASEMEMTMDEDAIPFVQKIYRMVIFETEFKRRQI